MRVALIGLGRMGFPMARHIAAAGHDLIVTDIVQEAVDRAEAAGLRVAAVDTMDDREVVCTSLPSTPHVRAVYTDKGAVFDMVAPGTVCVDLSTISVSGSREIAAEATERGLEFLDAPVSGTSIHVEDATAVVMVGGNPRALEKARPVIETFAAKVEHVGGNGAGLMLKLITNRLLTTHLAAIAEAIVALERTGLDVEPCLEMIKAGAVPRLLDYKASALVERDFTPLFTVDLMRKDLALAADALPPSELSNLTRRMLEQAHEIGLGEADLAAIIDVAEAEAAP